MQKCHVKTPSGIVELFTFPFTSCFRACLANVFRRLLVVVIQQSGKFSIIFLLFGSHLLPV